MEIGPRPAKPDDAAFLAWAILTAARSHLPRGTWDIAIDGTEEDRLALLERMVLSEVPSMFHYSGFVVSALDAGPAAALAAFDPADPGMSSPGGAMADAFTELGWSDSRLAVAFERLQSYSLCAPPLPPGTWVIEWVATLPEFRGQGLVQALLEAALDNGRRRGCTSAQVSFLIGNAAALRTYQKSGFHVIDELQHPEFEQVFGSPGMICMGRSI